MSKDHYIKIEASKPSSHGIEIGKLVELFMVRDWHYNFHSLSEMWDKVVHNYLSSDRYP